VTSVGSNIKAMFSPVFIFLFFAMALTAISEFGTTAVGRFDHEQEWC
jgi:hypothetical protein